MGLSRGVFYLPSPAARRSVMEGEDNVLRELLVEITGLLKSYPETLERRAAEIERSGKDPELASKLLKGADAMTKNSPTWSMPAFPAVVLSDARSHLRYRQISAISVRQDIVKCGCLQLGQSSSRRFFVWKNLQWKRSQSEDRRVGLSGWRRGEKRSVSA